MGDYAVNLIAKDTSGVCIGIIDNKLQYLDIEKALTMKRKGSIDLLEVAKRLA